MRLRLNPDGHEVGDLTVKQVTIATELPVARSYGEERLVLNEGSVDLGDFLANGLNLLDGHDPHARTLGTVINPVVVNGTVKADIVFDANYPKAVELYQSAVDPTQRLDLSIGYDPISFTSEKLGASFAESHTVTKVRIDEVSVVADGADDFAGFGRSVEDGSSTTLHLASTMATNEATPEMNKAPEPVASEAAPETREARPAVPAPAPAKSATPSVDEKAVRAAVREAYRMARVHDIANDVVDQWLDEGLDNNAIRGRILQNIEQRGSQTRYFEPSADAGSIPMETRTAKLSLRACMGALVKNATDGVLTDDERLALDVSKEVQGFGMVGRNQIRVPFAALGSSDTIRADAPPYMAGNTNQGQKYITDEINMSMLKEFLFNNTVTGQLGIETVTGLTNDLVVPQEKDTFTADWVGENVKAETKNITAKNFQLTPHTLIAATSITNLGRVQVPTAQGRLTEHLMRSLALKMDQTLFFGSGTGQEPNGLLKLLPNTRKTDAKAKFVTFNQIADAQIKIREGNIMDTPVIVCQPGQVNDWRQKRVGGTDDAPTGEYLWTNNSDVRTVGNIPGNVWGSPVYTTTNMASPTVIVGVFRHMIQAFWGNSFVMDIGEAADDFLTNRISFRMVAYADIGVSYPQAFFGYTNVKA